MQRRAGPPPDLSGGEIARLDAVAARARLAMCRDAFALLDRLVAVHGTRGVERGHLARATGSTVSPPDRACAEAVAELRRGATRGMA